MKQQHWGFALLGKGLFACAAVVLMLGSEQDVRAKQVQQVASPLQERLVDVRPAPLPTVRASADFSGEGAAQTWVF